MLTRAAAALIDLRLALARAIRRVWRVPGDVLGRLVMGACGVSEPTRRIAVPDLGEVCIVEDPRVGRYLDRAPLRPFAQTLGNVILARTTIPEPTLRHEIEHVRQWSVLGPLFLPAYGLASLAALLSGKDAYRDNRFEVAARAREAQPPSEDGAPG